ncbi:MULTISPECIES: SigE family RNA polymerase sigma factor [unclassified Nocardioides]|jgi:RNA polymerase sigma-70 factor (sigma-E family)|uniref:SigE family RNA polymerase sigma factor n=1 Tax=unclassified Nocardioides TaxID=2615069 RepID=UPI000702666E|nr:MULTISPECIES: SigE family RNA polymerase sigma factor [unclassified Nocardioides]KRC48761.1 RNA polymerase subunit sigma-70 [Nocardioides sp. Root79]KRC75160.1 RNA polymerase subunit sigma-70 [Nocardioides sp. Root240]
MPARDRAAFAEFVAARSGALHRAAYLMVGDVGLAQDLVQEALTKTYVAWPRLRNPQAAESYTRKAITTTAITWFRKRSWNAEKVAETLPERAEAGHADALVARRTLLDALAQLPPRQRAVIVLRYYEDLTERQAAEVLGCAVGTVKSQASAALNRLRDLMGDDLDIDDLLASEGVPA